MSELIIINDIFDQLKHENNRLLNELLFAQKNIQLLENFRDFSLKFSSKCICDQNIDYEKQLNGFENNYQIFMNENNKCINNNTISIKSEIIEETLLSNDINLESNDESIEKYITEESVKRKTSSESVIIKNQMNKCMENTDKPLISQWIGCEKRFKTKSKLRDHKRYDKKKIVHIVYPKKVILDTIRAGNIQIEKVEQNIKVFRKMNEKTGLYNNFGFGCDWNDCQYISCRKRNVLSHIRSEHTFEKPFVCTECEFKTNSNVCLRNHFRISHEIKDKKFKCDFDDCDYKSKTLAALQVHQKRHSGQRPYACDWPGCEFRATLKTTLKAHYRTHSNVKAFLCDWPGCEAAFKKNHSLKRHKKEHICEKLLVCDWPECGKTFKHRDNLIVHHNIHTGRIKYLCSWPGCGRNFKQQTVLTQHLRVHKGDKSVKCMAEGCDKTFIQRGNMRKHYRRMHLNKV